MKKFLSLLFILVLGMGLLAACGQESSPDESTKTPETEDNQATTVFGVTITDALGNEVVIEEKPERIVSLIPGNTEIAFGLGLGDRVVGVSDHDNYPEEVAEKERIGGLDFNVEKVISLQPDLVLAQANQSEAGLQQFRDAGIAVLVVNDAQDMEEVYESLIMIGTATGTKEEAETLVSDLKAKISEIQEKAQEINEEDRKTVLVEVSPAPEIYAVGANTFMNEMIQIINAENIVTEDFWPKMDVEAIIERNPDVIITTHGFYTEDPIGNVLSRDGWQDVTAVKNKQVVDVDSDAVTRTGPRIAQGVEELAKAVYPELFE